MNGLLGLRMMGVRMVMINMGLWHAALDTLPCFALTKTQGLVKR